MTLNAAAGRYLTEVARHQPSARVTEYQLANLITGLGADTLVADITDEGIAHYIARRRAQVSNASVNRETRVWRRALQAAGISDFRFHDLRRTAATRMLQATGNLKLVQQYLSHADIASTARYAHATTADVREAMERVESRKNTELAEGGFGNSLSRRA